MLEKLEEAIELDPEEAMYYFIYGLFLLRFRKFDKAYTQFIISQEIETLEYRKNISSLWMARSLDLAGKRRKAIDKYKEIIDVSENIYEDIKTKARHGLKQVYTMENLKRSNIFMPFADVIES
ncbi:MAG: hypothetical protein ABIA04_05350 [Pseudomonadota bacterium]